MKKILILFCCFAIMLTTFIFTGCAKNDEITISLSYDRSISCCFTANQAVDENYYTSISPKFVDNPEEYNQPSYNFKKGAELDIYYLTMVKVGYKVDRIYYVNKNTYEEINIYEYQVGDYSTDTGNSLNGMKPAANMQDRRSFTLPDFDITIYIISSVL